MLKTYNLFLESLNVLNENFWKWFGDSKTVNEDGSPKIFYHGTTNKFKAFDKSRIKPNGYHGDGFYFFDDIELARAYYGKFISVYLRVIKPFNFYAEFSVDEVKRIFGDEYNTVEDMINDELKYGNAIQGYMFYDAKNNDRLIKAGYDGIIQKNVCVVFEPNQIKSVKNNGDFSDSDNMFK